MTLQVLVVCTANAGRSPLGAALLRRRLAEESLDEEVRVASAGVDAAHGPLSEAVVSEGARHGVDLGEHRSTQLTARAVADADLILCMTGRHLDHVGDLEVGAAARAFLLARLARLVVDVGPRRPEEDLGAYLDRVRRRVDRVGEDRAGDRIEDPYGGPPGALAATAERLETLAEVLVTHLWPASEGQ